MNLTLPSSLTLIALACVVVSSCGKREVDPELIIPNQADIDLRKPARPVSDTDDYPLYPQVRESGPGLEPVSPVNSSRSRLPDSREIADRLPAAVETILKDPGQVDSFLDEMVSAMANSPAVLEGLQGIMAESGIEPGSVESYAPEIIGAILKGDSEEISQETVDQISGMISDYAPGVIDGILDQATQGEDSTLGAIAGFVLEKILEKK